MSPRRRAISDALVALDAGDLERAKRLLRSALAVPAPERDPLVTTGAFADALRRSGLLEESSAVLQSAIDDAPDDCERDIARCLLADHQIKIGQYEAAEESAGQVASNSAMYPHARAFLAVASDRLGRANALQVALSALDSANEGQRSLVLRTLGEGLARRVRLVGST